MNTRAVATVAGSALAGLALSAVGAQAAPGGLDPSFDGDGAALLPFEGSPLSQALVQPDGKIVLAGTLANEDFAVWRLNVDGTVDRTFGNQGVALVDFAGADNALSAALQGDGRIVLAGVTDAGTALARLGPDGSLDSTFDGDGKRVLTGQSFSELVTLGDGRLALLGTSLRSGRQDVAVVVLQSDGSIDSHAFEDADLGGDDGPAAAAPAPDGKLVVVGRSDPPGEAPRVVAVARYRANGSLDTSFGTGGTAALGRGTAHAVFVQPDSKVVVIGQAAPGQPITVTRLKANGAPDPTFGDGGTARAGFAGPELDAPVTGALQADGRVLVAGTSVDFRFAVTRFTAAGAIDAGFGRAGTAVVDFGALSAVYASALQPDGRYVLAGAALPDLRPRMAVARLLGDAPAGGSGDAPPAGDAAPALTRLRLRPERLRRGNRLPRIVTDSRRGPEIRFTLSEPARVRLAFRRRGSRGVGGRFTIDARAGAVRVRFDGRLSARRRLAPGRYRVIATPVDHAGNVGRPQRATFRLLPPRAGA